MKRGQRPKHLVRAPAPIGQSGMHIGHSHRPRDGEVTMCGLFVPYVGGKAQVFWGASAPDKATCEKCKAAVVQQALGSAQ